ncbi:hypothetical protein PAPYR_8126 [Paratrimastix pyriformis]|uniref:Uncharacterized protein n=1 Tax=Paratrimastix pyriformis TaxID=342808 RepID=A0ABQ8UCQ2_9EUKA|nr:hypothetical protein PAPYR_8126 [Paratrimastix pyriformis]
MIFRLKIGISIASSHVLKGQLRSIILTSSFQKFVTKRARWPNSVYQRQGSGKRLPPFSSRKMNEHLHQFQ